MTGWSLGRYLSDNASKAIQRRAAANIQTGLAAEGSRADIEVGLDADLWPSDVRFERSAKGYRVSYSNIAAPYVVVKVTDRTLAYLYWFRACAPEVRCMAVTLSDGDEPSRARFSPSTRFSDQVLIPDAHFLRDRGFVRARSLIDGAAEWEGRSDAVVWRGSLNGIGALRFDEGALADQLVLPRLRLVLAARAAERVDAGLTFIPAHFSRWKAVLESEGLLAQVIDEPSWLTCKYAIDIDGYTNTWTNLLIRMLYGCCVFKVESQLGFRQWYYDRIKPFEHFVPVRSDMSDLSEKIEWARSHQREAREIAAAGQRFAMALDFEAGKRDAVEIISANWDKS